MPNNRSKVDGEIELYELLQAIWNQKLTIFVFIFFSVLFSVGYHFTREPEYKSKIIYEIHNLPPFYNEEKASADFLSYFESKDTFDAWKAIKKDLSIDFSDMSSTKIVNGFTLAKGSDERLASLVIEKGYGQKKGNYYLLVKTNNLKILEEFYEYTSHLNVLLHTEYIMRAQKELSMIESRLEGTSTSRDRYILQLLSIDRYIVAASKEANTIKIKYPTKPIKISTGLSIILPMSIILGGIAGLFFILVRNIYISQKEKLTNSE